MRCGTRPRKIIAADSKEFGNRRAMSKRFLRMLAVMRIQSPIPAGRGSVQRRLMNGAALKTPATHGRTSNVISASGNLARTAFIAGIASIESPTQLGPRMRIFFKGIREDHVPEAEFQNVNRNRGGVRTVRG